MWALKQLNHEVPWLRYHDHSRYRLYQLGMILGEIDDVYRFSSRVKLLAYVGLDPSVYQSKNFQVKRARMSKHGSKILRYALMNVAHNVVKTTPPSKLIMKPRRTKTGLTTMLSVTVPTNFSGSSGRCSLTKYNSTLIRGYLLFVNLFETLHQEALLKLPFCHEKEFLISCYFKIDFS